MKGFAPTPDPCLPPNRSDPLMNHSTRLAGAVFCGLLVAGLVAAQETGDQEAAERLRVMQASVVGYEFRTADDRPLSLSPRPVLRWNNPVSGVKDGIVSMWTDANGRPYVVAQVFRTRDGFWLHEFQSLAPQRFTTTRTDGQLVWKPEHAGVTTQPLADAPTPAATPAARLVQMRALARTFGASVEFKTNSQSEDTTRYELRLLPRPLHRYAAETDGLVDGALFAFVQGTNPEVFLLLEAHRDGERVRWQYGLAPMTGYAVRADVPGGHQWESANQQKYRDRTDRAYFITRFTPE
jgi:hypothetical protein